MVFGWLTMAIWIGCSGSDKSEEIMAAQKDLASGKLSSAQTQLTAILSEVPENPDAATSMAHIHMLNGDFGQAEAVLNAVQSDDATVQSQIALRKALVALQAKDFSKAKEMAQTSQEDFAKILAAEISLMDGEYDEAIGFLEKVGGTHRALAKSYLKLLDGNEWSQAYAEAQALWALRDFDLAIQSVAGTMEFVSKSALDDNPNQHILLWASRAVAVAQPDVATQLLSLKGVPAASEDWRVALLKAMITTVDGDVSGGKTAFEALEGVAPAQAIHDAKATSVVVLSSLGKDGSSLLSGLRGTTGAYAAYRANDKSRAADMVDSTIFEQFLNGGL
jgi:tetratricopeptide (TPR) repeat protein